MMAFKTVILVSSLIFRDIVLWTTITYLLPSVLGHPETGSSRMHNFMGPTVSSQQWVYSGGTDGGTNNNNNNNNPQMRLFQAHRQGWKPNIGEIFQKSASPSKSGEQFFKTWTSPDAKQDKSVGSSLSKYEYLRSKQKRKSPRNGFQPWSSKPTFINHGHFPFTDNLIKHDHNATSEAMFQKLFPGFPNISNGGNGMFRTWSSGNLPSMKNDNSIPTPVFYNISEINNPKINQPILQLLPPDNQNRNANNPPLQISPNNVNGGVDRIQPFPNVGHTVVPQKPFTKPSETFQTMFERLMMPSAVPFSSDNFINMPESIKKRIEARRALQARHADRAERDKGTKIDRIFKKLPLSDFNRNHLKVSSHEIQKRLKEVVTNWVSNQTASQNKTEKKGQPTGSKTEPFQTSGSSNTETTVSTKDGNEIANNISNIQYPLPSTTKPVIRTLSKTVHIHAKKQTAGESSFGSSQTTPKSITRRETTLPAIYAPTEPVTFTLETLPSEHVNLNNLKKPEMGNDIGNSSNNDTYNPMFDALTKEGDFQTSEPANNSIQENGNVLNHNNVSEIINNNKNAPTTALPDKTSTSQHNKNRVTDNLSETGYTSVITPSGDSFHLYDALSKEVVFKSNKTTTSSILTSENVLNRNNSSELNKGSKTAIRTTLPSKVSVIQKDKNQIGETLSSTVSPPAINLSTRIITNPINDSLKRKSTLAIDNEAYKEIKTSANYIYPETETTVNDRLNLEQEIITKLTTPPSDKVTTLSVKAANTEQLIIDTFSNTVFPGPVKYKNDKTRNRTNNIYTTKTFVRKFVTTKPTYVTKNTDSLQTTIKNNLTSYVYQKSTEITKNDQKYTTPKYIKEKYVTTTPSSDNTYVSTSLTTSTKHASRMPSSPTKALPLSAINVTNRSEVLRELQSSTYSPIPTKESTLIKEVGQNLSVQVDNYSVITETRPPLEYSGSSKITKDPSSKSPNLSNTMSKANSNNSNYEYNNYQRLSTSTTQLTEKNITENHESTFDTITSYPAKPIMPVNNNKTEITMKENTLHRTISQFTNRGKGQINVFTEQSIFHPKDIFTEKSNNYDFSLLTTNNPNFETGKTETLDSYHKVSKETNNPKDESKQAFPKILNGLPKNSKETTKVKEHRISFTNPNTTPTKSIQLIKPTSPETQLPGSTTLSPSQVSENFTKHEAANITSEQPQFTVGVTSSVPKITDNQFISEGVTYNLFVDNFQRKTNQVLGDKTTTTKQLIEPSKLPKLQTNNEGMINMNIKEYITRGLETHTDKSYEGGEVPYSNTFLPLSTSKFTLRSTKNQTTSSVNMKKSNVSIPVTKGPNDTMPVLSNDPVKIKQMPTTGGKLLKKYATSLEPTENKYYVTNAVQSKGTNVKPQRIKPETRVIAKETTRTIRPSVIGNENHTTLKGSVGTTSAKPNLANQLISKSTSSSKANVMKDVTSARRTVTEIKRTKILTNQRITRHKVSDHKTTFNTKHTHSNFPTSVKDSVGFEGASVLKHLQNKTYTSLNTHFVTQSKFENIQTIPNAGLVLPINVDRERNNQNVPYNAFPEKVNNRNPNMMNNGVQKVINRQIFEKTEPVKTPAFQSVQAPFQRKQEKLELNQNNGNNIYHDSRRELNNRNPNMMNNDVQKVINRQIFGGKEPVKTPAFQSVQAPFQRKQEKLDFNHNNGNDIYHDSRRELQPYNTKTVPNNMMERIERLDRPSNVEKLSSWRHNKQRRNKFESLLLELTKNRNIFATSKPNVNKIDHKSKVSNRHAPSSVRKSELNPFIPKPTFEKPTVREQLNISTIINRIRNRNAFGNKNLISAGTPMRSTSIDKRLQSRYPSSSVSSYINNEQVDGTQKYTYSEANSTKQLENLLTDNKANSIQLFSIPKSSQIHEVRSTNKEYIHTRSKTYPISILDMLHDHIPKIKVKKNLEPILPNLVGRQNRDIFSNRSPINSMPNNNHNQFPQTTQRNKPISVVETNFLDNVVRSGEVWQRMNGLTHRIKEQDVNPLRETAISRIVTDDTKNQAYNNSQIKSKAMSGINILNALLSGQIKRDKQVQLFNMSPQSPKTKVSKMLFNPSDISKRKTISLFNPLNIDSSSLKSKLDAAFLNNRSKDKKVNGIHIPQNKDTPIQKSISSSKKKASSQTNDLNIYEKRNMVIRNWLNKFKSKPNQVPKSASTKNTRIQLFVSRAPKQKQESFKDLRNRGIKPKRINLFKSDNIFSLFTPKPPDNRHFVRDTPRENSIHSAFKIRKNKQFITEQRPNDNIPKKPIYQHKQAETSKPKVISLWNLQSPANGKTLLEQLTSINNTAINSVPIMMPTNKARVDKRKVIDPKKDKNSKLAPFNGSIETLLFPKHFVF